MPDIPDRPPLLLYAGDTAQWTRSLSDFPASEGWALGYTLVSSTAAHSFAGTTAGDDFAVTVAATDTAEWAAGRYLLTEFVSKAGERFTLQTYQIRIASNSAGAEAGADLRTHARKVLDAIEAWLEAKAPTAASFEIAGRRLSNYPLAELLALRDRYRAEVQREERVATGRGSGKLLVRL